VAHLAIGLSEAGTFVSSAEPTEAGKIARYPAKVVDVPAAAMPRWPATVLGLLRRQPLADGGTLGPGRGCDDSQRAGKR
jgi:hypothetical protein